MSSLTGWNEALNYSLTRQWDAQQQMEPYNEQLARLTVESCRRAEQKTLAAGVIAPLELLAEPFGETPFFELG